LFVGGWGSRVVPIVDSAASVTNEALCNAASPQKSLLDSPKAACSKSSQFDHFSGATLQDNDNINPCDIHLINLLCRLLYIRNTPYFAPFSAAFSVAAARDETNKLNPMTFRVSSGLMIPSSHSRALE
jgi:hypothetical protein